MNTRDQNQNMSDSDILNSFVSAIAQLNEGVENTAENKAEIEFRDRVEFVYKSASLVLGFTITVAAVCPPVAYLSASLLAALTLIHLYDRRHDYSISHWIDKKLNQIMSVVDLILGKENPEATVTAKKEQIIKNEEFLKLINSKSIQKLVNQFDKKDDEPVKISSHHAGLFKTNKAIKLIKQAQKNECNNESKKIKFKK